MKDFFDLIIERGVIGLAVGFILAQLIMQVIGVLLGTFIFPLISLLTNGKGLSIVNVQIGVTTFPFGDLITQAISILVTVWVITYLLKRLKTESKVA